MSPRSPQTSETVTRETECQHECSDGVLCESPVPISATYNPPDVYGADADGNRGVRRSAYFDDLAYGRCPAGCEYTDAEAQRMIDMATAEFADLLNGRDD